MISTKVKPSVVWKIVWRLGVVLLGLAIGSVYVEHRAEQRKRGEELTHKFEAERSALIEIDKNRKALAEQDAQLKLGNEYMHVAELEKSLSKLKVSEAYRQSETPQTDTDLQAIAIRARVAEKKAALLGAHVPSFQVTCSAGSRITDQGLAYLEGVRGLRTLILDGSPITDNGLDHLRKLPDLEVVSLRNTRVTEHEVNDLRRALPAVKILH